MDYVPISKYIDAYHSIIALQPLSFARRWVYLSSTIKEEKNLVFEKNSTAVVVYSKMPRMDHDYWHDFASKTKTHATMLQIMELY